MKKFILLVMVCLMFVPGLANARNKNIYPVMNGDTAISAGHKYSPITFAEVDTFSACYTFMGGLSGSGVAEVYIEISPDGINFSRVEGQASLIYNWTATAGPGADGWVSVPFRVPRCLSFKVVVEEVGVLSTVTPTAYIARATDDVGDCGDVSWRIIEMPLITVNLASGGTYDGTQVSGGYWDIAQMGGSGYLTLANKTTAGSGEYSETVKVSVDGVNFAVPVAQLAAGDLFTAVGSVLQIDQTTPIVAGYWQVAIANTNAATCTAQIKAVIAIKD